MTQSCTTVRMYTVKPSLYPHPSSQDPHYRETPSSAPAPGHLPTTLESTSFFAIMSILVRATDNCHQSTALVLKDNGSMDNFITHDLAEKLQLRKVPNTIYIKVLGDEHIERTTAEYLIELVDANGIGHKVCAAD